MVTPRNHNLRLDPGALHSELWQTIRGITERVSLALHALDRAPKNLPAGLPDVFVHHGILRPDEPIQEDRFGTVRGTTRTWIIGCGLRDAIEAMHHMLDRARQLCAVGALGRDAPWDRIPAERFLEEMQAPRVWRRAGLPDRMKFLRKRYDVHAELEPDVLSINKVRGCLVHRLGVVDRQDCNRPGGLHVTWRRMQPFAGSGDARSPVDAGAIVAPGTPITIVQWDKTERTFHLGMPVELSATDFSQMSWTCVGYAMHLGWAIAAHLRKSGMPVAET
ncbi:MAG: hypothetical protein R3F05_02255 [Planctomycetota bacterium]|nr:hypothetical protein [Planctomycetota bacterium]